MSRRCVCIITYGLALTEWQKLGNKRGYDFSWDYTILDEGHKIKNPSKTTKALHGIPSKNRIVLTGELVGGRERCENVR